MEMDGTLDSSNSGGRASGDSGAGTKQPEKRSRKLSRPRSLTNLVWETREHPDISMPLVDKPKKILDPAAIVYKKHSKYSISGPKSRGWYSIGCSATSTCNRHYWEPSVLGSDVHAAKYSKVP
ncbi:hypothetical protein HUJ05_006925, partial [Dendroctonus ponderosae]